MSTRPIDFAFHPLLVTLEKREIVTADQKVWEFQLALRRPLQHGCGFHKPAKPKIVGGKTGVSRRGVGSQSKSSFGCLNTSLILGGTHRAPSAQHAPGVEIPGIGLRP